MKKVFAINIVMIVLVNLLFCQQWQSYLIYGGDTINKVDKRGLKQGLWIFFSDDYKNRIVQKGYYKDGKKQGQWVVYYPNGNVKSKITYKDNKQYGPVYIYYPNGKINEQGYWKGNRWVGEYKYYYQNGSPMYVWNYNDQGKRTGEQKYFYENGNLHIVGIWQNGKEQGEQREYYENGILKRKSTWKDGKLDGEVIEYYADGQLKLKKFYVSGKEDRSKTQFYARATKVEQQKTQKDSVKFYQQFSGSGFYRFYNDKGQLVREGEFREGKLIKGKRYFYDKDGRRRKTEVIEDGKVVRIIMEKNVQQSDTVSEQNGPG